MTRLFPLAALLALTLAGCGSAPKDEAALADLDNALTATNGASAAADPALKSALQDQIMVDPALVQQANADTVRPPAQPESGAVPPDAIATRTTPAEAEKIRAAPPASGDCRQCAIARQSLTLGALAERQGGKAGQCAASVAYSAGWANRLPMGVPLYPDARVAEAAGTDGNGCALRVVSFASAAPMQRLLDWYYTRTSGAGYAAEHSAEGDQHVLAGTRKQGGAFMLYLKPRKDGGTDVDLMADGGA